MIVLYKHSVCNGMKPNGKTGFWNTLCGWRKVFTLCQHVSLDTSSYKGYEWVILLKLYITVKYVAKSYCKGSKIAIINSCIHLLHAFSRYSLRSNLVIVCPVCVSVCERESDVGEWWRNKVCSLTFLERQYRNCLCLSFFSLHLPTW